MSTPAPDPDAMVIDDGEAEVDMNRPAELATLECVWLPRVVQGRMGADNAG